MKKILFILILGSILFSESAKAEKMNIGETYENEILWKKKYSIKLPPGKFILLDRFEWSSWGVWEKGVWFVEKEGNKFHQSFMIYNVGSTGYTAYLRQWYHQYYFKGNYDGCYKRPEYTLVKVKKRGYINCWLVAHEDIQKELYSPDDPQSTSVHWKYQIEKNRIEYPRIILCSVHIFFAASLAENLTQMNHCINPESFGGPKSKFVTEDSSEYHPGNIVKYPEHKKLMEKFIEESAYRHKLFERSLRAKEIHKMDLSEFGIGEITQETKTSSFSSNSGSGLTEELKELHKLYKEGVLTKEQFEKAKKKILNQ